MQAAGLRNLTWRTPGRDQGRDIEGVSFIRDVSGYEFIEKWYIECKRYKTTINWPTVYEKLAYAVSQSADVLLVSTTSKPSPQCETEITLWNNSARSPRIRFWRGYDLPQILRMYPHVAAMYGLLPTDTAYEANAFSLAFLITKIAQAAYSAGIIGSDNALALEAASCLSELLSQRLDDLRRWNRLVPAPYALETPKLSWANISGRTEQWEDVGLRALLATIRYQFNAAVLEVNITGRTAKVIASKPKLEIAGPPFEQLCTVALWARAEVAAGPETNALHIQQRP